MTPSPDGDQQTVNLRFLGKDLMDRRRRRQNQGHKGPVWTPLYIRTDNRQKSKGAATTRWPKAGHVDNIAQIELLARARGRSERGPRERTNTLTATIFSRCSGLRGTAARRFSCGPAAVEATPSFMQLAGSTGRRPVPHEAFGDTGADRAAGAAFGGSKAVTYRSGSAKEKTRRHQDAGVLGMPVKRSPTPRRAGTAA